MKNQPKEPDKIKALKAEFDFLHKKIGELEWELATIHLNRLGVPLAEIETIREQLENYRDNMEILIEKVHEEVSRSNHRK